MPRYIDADWIIQKLERWRGQLAETYGENDEYVLCLGEVLMKLDDAPTADVRENVKGEWLHDEVTMNGNTVYTPNAKCSICDCYVFQESNFCPNCGADMRGDNNDRTNR